mgnify:CR=1 FL=1
MTKRILSVLLIAAMFFTMLPLARLTRAADGSGTFEDVPADAWYKEAVDWAVEQKITAGTDATHFSPDEICTRSQAVAFLYRSKGEDRKSVV